MRRGFCVRYIRYIRYRQREGGASVGADHESMPTSLLWMAPALSGGGYSSEAIAFAQGLSPLLEKRFKLRQFAEQPDENFFNGLPLSLSSTHRAFDRLTLDSQISRQSLALSLAQRRIA